MATLTITVPDTQIDRILKALGYDNSVPKAQFAKNKIIVFLKDAVKAYEVPKARQTSGITADAKVDSEIIIS